MARKSNKTAHVLGLITNEKQPAATDEEVQQETQEGEITPKPTRRAVVRKAAVPILDKADAQNKLADNIREKLLEELDGPAPKSTPPEDTLEEDVGVEESFVATPESGGIINEAYANVLPESTSVVPEGIPIPSESIPIESIPIESIPIESIPVTPFAPPPPQAVVADYPLEDFSASNAPNMPNNISVDVPQEPINNNQEPENTVSYTYINVIEELVKEKAPSHIKSNGVCPCNRCMMDTIALALTKLPSKYVVVEKGEGVPLLNYYGIYYQIQVISELTKACMIVKNSPHHSHQPQ